MQFSAVILILAFSRTTTLANPQHIHDEPGLDQDDATLSPNPLTLDSSVQATDLSPDLTLPVSSSEKLGSHAPDASVLNPVDQSAKLPLDPSLIDTSQPLIQNLPDNSLLFPSSYQPTDDPPNIPDSHTQASVSPGLPIAATSPKSQNDGPDCKGWKRLCCLGQIYEDGRTNYVTGCIPCIGSFLIHLNSQKSRCLILLRFDVGNMADKVGSSKIASFFCASI